uniref:Uncharacterized protein n=1 Tax=Physcomitrium patens TaxID=3218 RepID=A0A2K1IJ66_PHYPA|nr:hypothetical protein PHYPA_028009 [Physcomitrium patens]
MSTATTTLRMITGTLMGSKESNNKTISSRKLTFYRINCLASNPNCLFTTLPLKYESSLFINGVCTVLNVFFGSFSSYGTTSSSGFQLCAHSTSISMYF